jgi:YidC/Oxa1 family membrane protein insertase
MDRNTITGLVLIFAIFIGFGLYNSNRLNKEYSQTMERGDSLYYSGNNELARIEYLRALSLKPNDQQATTRLNEVDNLLYPEGAAPVRDTTASDPAQETGRRGEEDPITIQGRDPARFGAFETSAEGTDKYYIIENDLVELKISSKGGRPYSAWLKEFYTYDGEPLIMFDGDSTIFGFNFFTVDNRAVQTNDLYFKPERDVSRVDASRREATVAVRAYAGEDGYIEYRYTLRPGDYMVDLEIRFISLTDVIARNQNSLTLNWEMYIPQQEKSRANEDNLTSIRYMFHQSDEKSGKAEIDGFRERSNKDYEEEDISSRIKWVAFKNQFFSSVIIADDFFVNGRVTSTKSDPNSEYLRLFTAEIGVPYEAQTDNELSMQLYMGPNNIKTLSKYDLHLDELVFVGRNIIRFINRKVIITVFNLLNNHIANYGIIILILTVLIKLILSPLTFKSYQSQAKMKVLKPMVDEINKKYPKQEDAMKKQQAVMALYKKAGVNPLGGCLPLILQMPFLFAMFRFFPSSIELRQEGFLWADDLSTYDSILELPFTIPMYGDHVSLFTLLMTVSTVLTMRLNTPSAGGQEQVPGMKMMMYIMPFMFMLILNNFSSGLTYYYFLANVITFGQNMLTKRFIDEKKIMKKIEENSKKPVKKSNWQKRMEEAAKKRGYKPRK